MKETLFDFVGEIYEAAYNPEHWNTVIKQLCILLNAKSAGIFVQDYETGKNHVVAAFGVPKMFEYLYNLGLGSNDVVFKLMLNQPVGKVETVLTYENAKKEYPMYTRLLMKPANTHFIAGAALFNDKEWYGGIGVHRTKEQGDFEADTLKALSLLSPHFQRALKIQREFQKLRLGLQNLDSVLSRITLGVVIVNEQNAVQFINPIAESIVKQHPALQIQPSVRAHIAKENSELQDKLAAVSKSDAKSVNQTSVSMALNHPSRETPLHVTLLPLSDTSILGSHSDSGVIIFLSDYESPLNVPYESLCSVYELTKAEAKVAVALSNGISLSAYSKMHNVSVNTVRTQLKRVFEKTGASSQPELVRLILVGPFNLNV